MAGTVVAAACGGGHSSGFVGDAGVDAMDDGGGPGGSSAGTSQGGVGGGGSGGGGSGGDGSVGACASDAECTAALPHCDPVLGICVQCGTSADCGADAECIDATCVPIRRCVNSLDCAAVGVCDTTAQRCVDCLSDVDCAATERCVSQTCVPVCDSDRDCTPIGLLCDLANGYCVRCLSHVDCPALQFCREGACVNDICRAGSPACQGNGTAVCTGEGDGYGEPVPCALGEVCVATSDGAWCQVTGDDVLLIDDMEDADQRIASLAGRTGYWWTSNDGTGSQYPSPTDTYLPELLEAPRGTSTYAIHATGSGFSIWGAVVKLDFNNSASGLGGGMGSPGVYDVRGYNGVTFYARGSGSLRVEVRTAPTVLVAEGGTCSTYCNDHYGKIFVALTSSWAPYTMAWSELTQRGFGGATAWSPTTALGLQFLPGSLTSFDVWIDDVRFY